MIGILGQALLLGIGGDMVLHDQLHVAVLIAFLLYLGRFFQPIQLLVQQYNVLQQGRSSIIRLRELLETPPARRRGADAPELPVSRGRDHLRRHHLRLRPARDPVLHARRTSRSRPARSVAFVGPTGAGKSTMAKLVNRFYDPQGGRVLLDGIDIRDVTLHSLRTQIGVVPQEPFLFAGSIRDNLVLRQPRRDRRRRQRRAVDAVGLRELVDRLPHGIDTVVHERGQTLSAGERQLLALGRAFLSHPRVLVLDEATSSLDLRSETVVERALDRAPRGPLRDPHRAPPHDGQARGPHRRDRRRRHRRVGLPRRARGARRRYAAMYDDLGPPGRPARAAERQLTPPAVDVTSATASRNRGQTARGRSWPMSSMTSSVAPGHGLGRRLAAARA